MKKIFTLFVAFTMLLSLAACCPLIPEKETEPNITVTDPMETQPVTPPTESSASDVTEADPTEALPTEPEETEPEETEPEETEPEETVDSKFPYLETVNWKEQPIHSGPGSYYTCNGTVGVTGVYTIVEEDYDMYGNLWGKLKSGAGWINLTDSRNREPAPERPLLYCYYTGGSGDQLYMGEYSDYQVRVGFTFEEDLSFTFCELTPGQYSYAVVQELDWGYLNRGQVFVAQITFWGDITTYGMTVTDSHNNTYYYAIHTRGDNGDLVFEEYTPGNI